MGRLKDFWCPLKIVSEIDGDGSVRRYAMAQRPCIIIKGSDTIYKFNNYFKGVKVPIKPLYQVLRGRIEDSIIPLTKGVKKWVAMKRTEMLVAKRKGLKSIIEK